MSHFPGCKILTCLDHISSGLQSGFSSLRITPGAHSIPITDRSSFFYSRLSVSWNAVKSPNTNLTSVNRLHPSSHFSPILSFPIFQFFCLLLSLPFSFSRIKRAWWFDRTGPRNLLPPSRPSQVSAPSLNCYLPHFWAFPWQLGASERVSEKERGLQWKQHLVSDSCLLKRQRNEEKKQNKTKKKTRKNWKVW